MKNFLVCLATLFAFCCAAMAQGTSGIEGTVLDVSQAVVPSAEVALTNLDTGETRVTVASQEGYFSFTDLNPARYKIRVSSSGFKAWEQRELALTVGQRATINPTLALGAVSDTVEVSAAAPLVTTAESSISSLVDSKRIEELPLNGRNALQLVGLAPGFVSTGSQGQFGATQVTFASAGGRDIDVNYSLDGGFNMNQFYGAPNEYPNPDSLQEFAVTSRAYNAQFGRGTSSVSAVTRSGTNNFHGSAFWFLRNTDLDARPFFAADRPNFKRNQYGGTLGGPIVRNKLFFFVGYQGTKRRGSAGSQAYPTLTAAERNGNFSALKKPIIDPQTNQPFLNNIIRPDRIQPQALAFLQQFLPAANSGSGDTYNFTVADKLDQNQVITKVDYLFTVNDRISGRYLYNDVPQTAFASGSGSALGPNWVSDLPTRFQNATLSYLHTFTPTLLNDAHLTYVRNTFGVLPSLDFELKKLGYPVSTGNAFSDFGLIPDSALSVTGYFGAYEGAPTRDIIDTWNVNDNLSWVHGIHSLNFGMELYRNRVNEVQNFFTGGSLNFSGQFTGNAAADFLLGKFESYQQIGGLSSRLRQTLPSFYVQDDIRVSRTVTVNAGIRWDIDSGYKSENKQLSTFRPGQQSALFPNAPNGLLYPGDQGLPGNIVGSRWNNVAPRIGIAWDVFGTGKTSVRAGFGIFYSPFTRGISLNRFTLIQPYTANINVFGGDASNIFAAAPFNGVNPFPRPTASDLNGLRNLAFTPTASESALALPFKTQGSNEWSFSIQQQLWKKAVLEVDYVGSSSSHLNTSVEGNPAIYIFGSSTVSNTQNRRIYPDIGSINVIASALSSNYNSLQASFRQNYSYAVTVQSSYTYSKALGVNGSEGEGSNGTRDPFNQRLDYGPLSYDVTHNWVTSLIWQPLDNVKFSNAIANALIRGWGLSGIFTVRSGTPLNLSSGRDNSLTGIGSDTPDQVGDWHIPGDRSKASRIQSWFNPSAFAPNALGTYGQVGINALRNPGYWNTDVAFQRVFVPHEGYRLEFRGSLYNAFNHANLGGPDSTQSSPSFGRIFSTSDPRVVEFGLRFSF